MSKEDFVRQYDREHGGAVADAGAKRPTRPVRVCRTCNRVVEEDDAGRLKVHGAFFEEDGWTKFLPCGVKDPRA